MRIGAHPGAAQPYLASPSPPPPTIDYMMYGVCDMVSYLNNFFTEDKQMTSKETLLVLLDSLTPEDITLMLSLLETRREEARPVPPSCSQSLL